MEAADLPHQREVARLHAGHAERAVGRVLRAVRAGRRGDYDPADLGFFNFNNDLDTLEKLETGAAVSRDPGKPAANSFNHPFLGPMTKLKQGLLIEYLQANSAGEMLDPDTLKRVSAEDNSFKYTGGTAYGRTSCRTAWCWVPRRAHRRGDPAGARMSRALVYWRRAARRSSRRRIRGFDSEADFARLPGDAQGMLRKVFPSKMQPGLEYNAQEQLALEVFRNFGYPMRDWEAQLRCLGRSDLGNTVKLAQRSYSAKLARIAADLAAGRIMRRRRRSRRRARWWSSRPRASSARPTARGRGSCRGHHRRRGCRGGRKAG